MMKAVLAVLLLVGVSTASLVNDKELNTLIRQVFGAPPNHSRNKRDAQTDYENSVCECVPYYQCSYNGQANEDGDGIIDIRVGTVESVDNPTAGRRPCDHYLEVCCLPPEYKPGNDLTPTQPPQNGNGGQNVYPTPPPQNGNGGQNVNPNQPTSHVNKGCGFRNPNGIGFRITGNYNNEANFAEFPWMVAILQASVVGGNPVKAYQCGGSLIHKRVVLTAAHCVFGKAATDLTIRAGEWDTQTTNEGLPHQDRGVSVVITHPNYKPNILHNDFALLILQTAVDLADNVEIVCLPEANEYFDNSKCFATGWGKSDFGDKGKYQVILKSVELPVVPHNTCQNSLRNTRLGKYFKLDQSFLCAGGVAGVDTCTGDGGSPLVCPLPYDPTRYTQAGIVAWGIGCGSDGVPGVYGDVTKARQWIDQTLASYSIDSLSYSPGANNNYPPIQG